MSDRKLKEENEKNEYHGEEQHWDDVEKEYWAECAAREKAVMEALLEKYGAELGEYHFCPMEYRAPFVPNPKTREEQLKDAIALVDEVLKNMKGKLK